MNNTKRIFILGEEWLYYKIYCGVRTADQILVETLYPLVNSLLKKKQIDSWFFIRYGDPDFHIRFRLHIANTQFLGSVILELKNALHPYVANDVIYKIQTDTYIRELERYGAQNIETSEMLFFKESQLLVQFRGMIEDESLYFLTIIKMIDQLLHSFGYDSLQKLELAHANADSFKKEFMADKRLTKQLDQKYRKLQDEIHTFFCNPESNEEFGIINNLLQEHEHYRTTEIQKVKSFLATNQENFTRSSILSSYIHMLVNRAFRSKQRFYELVCYDFLARYYRRLVFADRSK